MQAWSANLLQLLNYRLDIFILSALATRSAVGVYSIAVSVTALGWVLCGVLLTGAGGWLLVERPVAKDE